MTLNQIITHPQHGRGIITFQSDDNAWTVYRVVFRDSRVVYEGTRQYLLAVGVRETTEALKLPVFRDRLNGHNRASGVGTDERAARQALRKMELEAVA